MRAPVALAFATVRFVSAGWINTDFQTALRCTTQFASGGNASSVDTDWLTTNTLTTTEWLYFTKTELYTPKASITTLSAIATSHEQSMIDEWTSIATTATETSTVTLKTITTKTITAATATISATEDLNSNRIGDCSLSASGTHVQDKNNWEVADVYWTTEPEAESSGIQNRTSPTEPAGVPVRVDCTLITQSNNFWATISIKQSGPTATYTRTTVVATETSTLIAKTRRNKFDTTPTFTETWEWSEVTWITACQTSTTTATVTATKTVCTGTALPRPCDYDEGIFEPYHRLGLSRIDTENLVEIFYHYKYNNNGKSYQSGSDCCEEAAREPRAVAWYQKPYLGCSIYVGEHCPNRNGTVSGGRKETATVYYDTTPGYEDTAYGSVGGGQCGNLEFVNVWA